MKIIIFTPAIATSAIGRVMVMVCRALQDLGHDISIVRTEIPDFLGEAPHPFNAEIVPWTDEARVMSLLADADMKIYQIGDHYPYHCGCLHWLARHPGIVCIHDFFLGNLFWPWSNERRDEAHRLLSRWYGEERSASYFNYNSPEAFIEGTANTAPMTEWVSAMATGVVTHSKWGLPHITRACQGPVVTTPLCYDTLHLPSTPAPPARPIDFRLLTIGNVNANKRSRSVIQAIGYSALLRERVIYRLVGYCRSEIASELRELADRLGVKLIISGEVDDDTLSAAIAEADAVSCLRWPTLEAASASLIEALLNGKASVVTEAGFYQELPDHLVRKIDPCNEVPELQAVLEDMVRDPARREQMASGARAWAEQTFSAENYARTLLAMYAPSRTLAPRILAAGYFSRVLKQWGAPPQMETSLP